MKVESTRRRVNQAFAEEIEIEDSTKILEN